MSIPSDSDYQLALQDPQRAFADEELRAGVVEGGSGGLAGLPRPRAGAFATTYKVQCGRRAFAVRCFTRPIPLDLESRYVELERHLALHWLPQLVRATFLPKGLLVRGRWWPVVKMDWAQGESLERYVAANLEHPGALFVLAVEWLELLASLREAGIAHGDLHHGNVLVTPEGLKLVDYDGMFVPALEGFGSHEQGHASYQHPRRARGAFHARLDHFAAWSVWLSLVALAHAPSLWTRFHGGDDCLLFRRKDYEAPERSAVLQALLESPHARVRAAAASFQAMLALPEEQVPALEVAALSALAVEPRAPAASTEPGVLDAAEVMARFITPPRQAPLAFAPEHSPDQQMAAGFIATAALGLIPSMVVSAGWLLGVGVFGGLGLWCAHEAWRRDGAVRQGMEWRGRQDEARRFLDTTRAELASRERAFRLRETAWRDSNAEHLAAQEALHARMSAVRAQGAVPDRMELDLLEGRRAQLDREAHNAVKDLEAEARAWREDRALQAALSDEARRAWERRHAEALQRLAERFDERRLALETSLAQELEQARTRGTVSSGFRSAMQESRRLSASFRSRDVGAGEAWWELRRARLLARRALLESEWALDRHGRVAFSAFLLHLLRVPPERDGH